MKNYQPYIVNHSRALKFPWSIYHKPLMDSLNRFLTSIDDPKGKKVLVIGPGDFQEMSLLLNQEYEISVLDIDERVLSNLRSQYGELIKHYYLVDENLNGYPPAQSYHLVYAKEVIEHLPGPSAFLKQIRNVLVDNGKLWLSTPNYGFFLLPLLENTILEIIARLSGFSRRDIHPTKLTTDRIAKILQEEMFQVELLDTTFAKLAITVVAVKQ